MVSVGHKLWIELCFPSRFCLMAPHENPARTNQARYQRNAHFHDIKKKTQATTKSWISFSSSPKIWPEPRKWERKWKHFIGGNLSNSTIQKVFVFHAEVDCVAIIGGIRWRLPCSKRLKLFPKQENMWAKTSERNRFAIDNLNGRERDEDSGTFNWSFEDLIDVRGRAQF